MSKQIWLISDTHFGHHKMYDAPFLREDGTRMRPFSSAEEADEVMVERWNAVVRPQDKVYHLGDVAMKKHGLTVLPRLNGDKVLIAGNHCVCLLRDLGKHFRDIRPYWYMDKLFFSHIPIHPDSVTRFRGNIHGHLHHKVVTTPNGCVDTRYLSVCVEHTDYTPIALEEVSHRLSSQKSKPVGKVAKVG